MQTTFEKDIATTLSISNILAYLLFIFGTYRHLPFREVFPYEYSCLLLAFLVLSTDVLLVDIMKRTNCLIKLFIVLRTGERF